MRGCIFDAVVMADTCTPFSLLSVYPILRLFAKISARFSKIGWRGFAFTMTARCGSVTKINHTAYIMNVECATSVFRDESEKSLRFWPLKRQMKISYTYTCTIRM